MPKLKTNRAAKKRFRATATGKFKRHSSGKNHILTKKGPGHRRRLRGGALVSKPDHKRIEMLLPNG
jgi:large subunit ribosomal protein L35